MESLLPKLRRVEMIEIQRSGRTVALWDEERQKLYPMVSGGVSAPVGGNARPGVPTWARQNANYADRKSVV